MSISATIRAGRAAAERLMTDTWRVYRVTGRAYNPATKDYDDETVDIYTGPGKLQTFEAYEQRPEIVGHDFTVMRPHLHLPINDATALVHVDDVAVCEASELDPALVGAEVRIAGLPLKTHATARRLPVEHLVA